MVSSHMPQMAPPREKMIMVTGMNSRRRARFCPKSSDRLWMTALTAPVFWMTLKAPPQMKTMAMIIAAATKPLAGETNRPSSPCGRLSTRV